MTFCGEPHPTDPGILCSLAPGHLPDGVLHWAGPEERVARWDSWRPSVSDRQRRILEFVRDHMAREGFPPSAREVGAHVGLSSTSSVAHQLRELERKGYLRRVHGKARAVAVTMPNEVAS